MKNALSFCALFVVFVVSCGLLPEAGYAQGETMKGTILTTSNQTLVANEFTGLSGEKAFHCTYNGNSLEIPLSLIKKLTRQKDDLILIEKRDGNQFLVKGTLYNLQERISYSFFDPISEQYSSTTIHYNNISEIVFDDDFGNLRKCETCEATFPPNYVFCPFDKSDLVLIKVK